ncbi:MAG: DCC1-like thiol-disulfide oxidoreductase family protein [Verrucomicrobiae bacterium]|nr:DCC1-like thiol-disulfide oxidoreductase family protein [Verrucomicrobiae bacterium]
MKATLPSFLLLFDGECGLCDRGVHFFISRDKRQQFYFAPLHGETARKVRERHRSDWGEELSSMVWVENYNAPEEKIFRKSDAVVKAFFILGGFWKTMAWLIRVIPHLWRDKIYDIIVKNRYVWFGKTSFCEREIKNSEKKRFLE